MQRGGEGGDDGYVVDCHGLSIGDSQGTQERAYPNCKQTQQELGRGGGYAFGGEQLYKVER